MEGGIPYRQEFECFATLVTPTAYVVQPPPFPSIVLVLSGDFTVSRSVIHDEDMVENLVSEYQEPLMGPIIVPISIWDVYSYRRVYGIIQECIKYWPGRGRDRKKFIEKTFEHCLDAVESMGENDSHVFVHVHMTARLHQLFEVSRDYDDDDVADDSSSEICTVCLEELSDQGDGGVISKLPCSHVFHQDCIAKWGGVSRFCPNCRFEMPTTI